MLAKNENNRSIFTYSGSVNVHETCFSPGPEAVVYDPGSEMGRSLTAWKWKAGGDGFWGS